jgi:hypothetical protein
VCPVRYELGLYIQEYDILHSHRRGNLKCYIVNCLLRKRDGCDVSQTSGPPTPVRNRFTFKALVVNQFDDVVIGSHGEQMVPSPGTGMQ